MASPSAATGVQGARRSSRRTSPCEAERRARLPLTAESSENTGSFLPAPVRMRLNAVSWVCTDVREMRLFFSSVYGMESELKSHLQGQQLQAQAAPLHAPRSAGCPPRAERGRLSRTEPGRAPAAVRQGKASPWEPLPRGGDLGFNRLLGPPAGRSERGQSQEPSPVGRVLRRARHCPLHHGASQTPPETSLSPRCIMRAGLSRGGGRHGERACSKVSDCPGFGIPKSGFKFGNKVIAQVSASKSLGSNSVTM